MTLKMATAFALLASGCRFVFGIYSTISFYTKGSAFGDMGFDARAFFNFGTWLVGDLALTIFFLVLFLKQKEREA